jgi:CBS domain containing-hemolysin-like protein
MEYIPYILLSLLFSAFFSGMEIAFVSANKLEIEIIIKRKSQSGKIIAHLYKNPGLFIGTMLLGNNISLVVYGILMANFIEPLIIPYIQSPALLLLTQTVISTTFILVAAEFIPKAIFRLNPKIWLVRFSQILNLFYYILWIPTRFTIGISEWLLKVFFRVEKVTDRAILGRVDLDNYIRERTELQYANVDIEPEVEIFQNALDFQDVKVRESMIPRNEITAISIEEDKDVALKIFIETGHSKILVYNDSIDNIIGYIHSLEMFQNPDSIKNILRPISIIPEAIAAKSVLELFIKDSKNIAVVVDEFGGTAGMVTIEDVVEEIFGEIEDEFDKDELVERKINDKNYILSARHEIDSLNDTYSFNIPESDEYETLSGFIIHQCEGLPDVGKLIETPLFFITILKVKGPKILEVQFTLKS